MEAITHKPSFNLGGNLRVWITRHSNILSLPPVVGGTIVANLPMLTGWTALDPDLYSISITEEEGDDDAGTYSEVSVTLRISKQAERYAAAVATLRKERIAVLVEDPHYGLRLIGGPREYLKHSRAIATGSNPAELHAATVTLVGRLRQGMVYYAGAIEIAEGIGFARTGNLGGNLSLYIVRHTAVAFVPDGIEGEIDEDLLQLAELWTPIEVIPYSIDYTEEEADTDAGPALDVAVTFRIAQDQAGLRAKLQLLRQERLAVLIESINGYFRLIGNQREYLKHIRNYTSGAHPTELNQHTITIAGRLLSVPVFYRSEKSSQISPTNEFLETEFDQVEFN